MLQQLTSLGYGGYALSLVALWLTLGTGRRLRERAVRRRHRRVLDAGGEEPPSLHPRIDPLKCVGCGACTHACPEGRVIGLIGGKAQLVDPASCIGHGACQSSCPVGAIDLVFGTARRGVDIPLVSPKFETSVSGLYIAGELGGMGLIANAIEQGRQAIDAIAASHRVGKPGQFDVVIVGGGPAGISASLAAREKGLRALTLEQDSLGGAIARHPRGKLIMMRPARLPLVGRMLMRRARKEALLAFWRSVIAKTGIEIREGIRVERIKPVDDAFEVTTSAGPARAGAVLLATGRRSAPLRLGVPGEGLPKVRYGLDDPARYRHRNVLVVGGGDSAIEAAVALSRQPVASVVLCHRGATFPRARAASRDALDEAVSRKKLYVFIRASVRSIAPDRVLLDQTREDGSIEEHELYNDVVIVCAGGTLPTTLLADAGVVVERKFGTP